MRQRILFTLGIFLFFWGAMFFSSSLQTRVAPGLRFAITAPEVLLPGQKATIVWDVGTETVRTSPAEKIEVCKSQIVGRDCFLLAANVPNIGKAVVSIPASLPTGAAFLRLTARTTRGILTYQKSSVRPVYVAKQLSLRTGARVTISWKRSLLVRDRKIELCDVKNLITLRCVTVARSVTHPTATTFTVPKIPFQKGFVRVLAREAAFPKAPVMLRVDVPTRVSMNSTAISLVAEPIHERGGGSGGGSDGGGGGDNSPETPTPTNTPSPTPTSSPSPTPTPTPPPCSLEHIDIEIAPGTSIQNAVTAAPSGTAFLLKAGVHRMQTITPKAGDSFYGELDSNCERQTILNGSRLLTTFTRSGSYYVASNQTQEGYAPSDNDGFQKCERGYDRCRHPEDLFLNDTPLTHVETLAEVGPGKWYFDYPNDTIYFFDNPAGKKVEASVTDHAFEESASANNVRIQDLIIEKYAAPLEQGVIHNSSLATHWRVDTNEIRLNHGIGIQLFTHGHATNNIVHDQGQYGINAHGTDVVFEDNEVMRNNIAHVNSGWGAGGSKFVQTTNLIVRNNCVYANNGPGLWTDIDNTNTLYEKNIVFQNRNDGIFHEISSQATIRNNLVGQNGLTTLWMFGAQILLSNSSNVDVSNNVIEVNPSFGQAIGIIWTTREYNGTTYGATGNTIHNNTVTFLGSTNQNGSWQGAVTDIPEPRVFSTNSFQQNHYHAPNQNFTHFAWNNAPRNFAYFRSQGQDTQGSMDTQVVPISSWSCNLTPP